MDRDDIERRDFASAKPGDAPEAVHEHLRRVADELDDRPLADAERAVDDVSASAGR